MVYNIFKSVWKDNSHVAFLSWQAADDLNPIVKAPKTGDRHAHYCLDFALGWGGGEIQCVSNFVSVDGMLD